MHSDSRDPCFIGSDQCPKISEAVFKNYLQGDQLLDDCISLWKLTRFLEWEQGWKTYSEGFRDPHNWLRFLDTMVHILTNPNHRLANQVFDDEPQLRLILLSLTGLLREFASGGCPYRKLSAIVDFTEATSILTAVVMIGPSRNTASSTSTYSRVQHISELFQY